MIYVFNCSERILHWKQLLWNAVTLIFRVVGLAASICRTLDKMAVLRIHPFFSIKCKNTFKQMKTETMLNSYKWLIIEDVYAVLLEVEQHQHNTHCTDRKSQKCELGDDPVFFTVWLNSIHKTFAHVLPRFPNRPRTDDLQPTFWSIQILKNNEKIKWETNIYDEITNTVHTLQKCNA